jgi:hypothetical protein
VRIVNKSKEYRNNLEVEPNVNILVLCFLDFDNPKSAATAMEALQGYRMVRMIEIILSQSCSLHILRGKGMTCHLHTVMIEVNLNTISIDVNDFVGMLTLYDSLPKTIYTLFVL